MKNNIKTNLGKLIPIFIILILTGCSSNRFRAEKLFWQAEKIASKITKGKSKEDLADKDMDKIIAAYRRVVSNYPLEALAAKAQVIIANLYLMQEEPKKAQKELEQIIHNFFSRPKIASSAQFAIGEIFENQGKSDKALIEYQKVVDLYPLTPLGLSTPLYITQYYKKLGDTEGQRRAHRQAVRNYKKIILDYADTEVASMVQNYLAQAYLQQEDWDEAIKAWDEIIIKHPNTPQAIRSLITKAELRARELDDLEGAIKIYQDCIRKYPKAEFLKEIKLRLAGLYLESSQVYKAKDTYSLLMKNYPNDEEIILRSRLGIINYFKKQGLKDEVVKHYRDIQKIHPETTAALSTPYLIYRYYKKIGDPQNTKLALNKAISEYEKKFSVKKKSKDNLVAARLLFLCYSEKKDWDKALNLLRGLADNNKEDPGFLLSMAVIYSRELEDSEQAKKIYQEVINKYSSNKALIKLIKEQIVSLDEPLLERNAGK